VKLDVRFTFKLELVGEIKMHFEIFTLNCTSPLFSFQGLVFIFKKSSTAHNVTFITNYLDNIFSNNAEK